MNKTKIFILTSIISFSLSLLTILIFFLLAINGIIKLNPKLKSSIEPKILPKEEKIIVEKRKKIETNITDLENNLTNVIKKVSPAVVNIIISKKLKIFVENPFDFYGGKVIEKEEKIGGGSGIGITSDGYIITNKHVVADLNADYSVITRDGDIYTVSKIWFDPIFDLAVIKIVDKNGNPPHGLKTAKIKSIKEIVKIGQFVVAIGNALGEYENTATFGIISAKGRILKDLPPTVKSLYMGLYQTDAAINPGNSGGPLINMDGEVIGINTAISAIGQGIGFALPINQEMISATIKSIEKYGIIKRPFIGILYTQLNKSIAKTKGLKYYWGAYVKNVIPGSPAAKAGIMPGDIILKVNGIDVTIDNPLPFILYTFLPGDEIELLVYKSKIGQKENITLKLAEYK